MRVRRSEITFNLDKRHASRWKGWENQLIVAKHASHKTPVGKRNFVASKLHRPESSGTHQPRRNRKDYGRPVQMCRSIPPERILKGTLGAS